MVSPLGALSDTQVCKMRKRNLGYKKGIPLFFGRGSIGVGWGGGRGAAASRQTVSRASRILSAVMQGLRDPRLGESLQEHAVVLEDSAGPSSPVLLTWLSVMQTTNDISGHSVSSSDRSFDPRVGVSLMQICLGKEGLRRLGGHLSRGWP